MQQYRMLWACDTTYPLTVAWYCLGEGAVKYFVCRSLACLFIEQGWCNDCLVMATDSWYVWVNVSLHKIHQPVSVILMGWYDNNVGILPPYSI